MPFVIGIFIAGIALAVALNGSWVGQVMRRGPEPQDPLGGVTQTQARQLIEQRITEGLTAVGAKGKFAWTVGGQPSDINSPNPIELTVETSLADKNARHQIINPIKDYMGRGRVPTLTMNDAKSHSTWTYTSTMPAPTEDNAEQMPEMNAPTASTRPAPVQTAPVQAAPAQTAPASNEPPPEPYPGDAQ